MIPDVAARPTADRRSRVVFQRRHAPILVPLAQNERNRDQSHYQRLLQRLYDAALVAEPDGRIIDVNERAVDFLQYGASELRGMSVSDVISGADDAVLRTVSENLVRERHTLIQAYCLRKDGSHFPAEVAVSELDLGKVHLCFFIRDITVRRQAEEMLITEHNAIQHSGNGIAVVNLKGVLEYANPTMERMWQCPERDGLMGKPLQELVPASGPLDQYLHDLLVAETPAQTLEIRARRKDGSEFDVQVSGARNRNADGENIGYVLSLMDISDRMRAEEAERELERRRVMLESLGAACHHLAQPATVLLGNLELLRNRLASVDPETRKLVQSSLDAMDKLTEVLHRLTGVNEYRTTSYLGKTGDSDDSGSRILDI